jgi:hypothetical protein
MALVRHASHGAIKATPVQARVFRALRASEQFKGLRVVFSACIDSMLPLLNALSMVVLLCCVFAMLGQQLFAGCLRQRCALSVNTQHALPLSDALCLGPVLNALCGTQAVL